MEENNNNHNPKQKREFSIFRELVRNQSGQQLQNSKNRGPSSNIISNRNLAANLVSKIRLQKRLNSLGDFNNEPQVGCLFCLQMNEDASILATSAADCVHIWNVATGELLHSLREHTEIVTSLVWFSNPAESKFFTCSLDKTIKLWSNYKVTATLKEHQDWIRCVSLNSLNNTLVSGCVSSTICGWDVETLKIKFKVPQAHVSPNCPDLNTINSIHFSNHDENIFVSGARDGSIKIRDMRTPVKPVYSIQTHKNKINNVVFSENDQRILTSGRDGTIRLWDTRKFAAFRSTVPEVGENGLIREYSSHQCAGYNIGCSFFNNENHIVTGSEDKYIYIYDTLTGSLTKRLDGHSSVVHLIGACKRDPLLLASASIESGNVLLWSPDVEDEPQKEGSQVVEDIYVKTHRIAIEKLMKKHGDQVLKVFHKHNFTFNSAQAWQSLVTNANNDNSSAELLRTINEMAADLNKTFMSFNRQRQQTQQQQQQQTDSTTSQQQSDDEDEDEDESAEE